METNSQVIVRDNEIKKIIFKGLVSFTSLCEKNNLRYYLAFGSLLGAVRHKGYIPWDDDIDLLMPRKDYEILRSISHAFETEQWKLLSYMDEPKFLLPFVKYCNKKTVVMPPRFNTGFIYGLSIDIFPLDFVDGESEESVYGFVTKMKEDLIRLERASYKTAVYKKGCLNSLKRRIKKLAYLINQEKIKTLLSEYRRLDNVLAEKSLSNGEYAVYMYNRYNTVWKKEDFVGDGMQYQTLEFEGREFVVPYNFDAVLAKTYGDYMKLPPRDKQFSEHAFTAYYVN